MIISSEIIIDTNDGVTRSITERHTHSDGTTQLHSYITDMTLDIDLTMQLRAQKMNAVIAAREAAEAAANNFEVPLFKSEFRDRFTDAEQAAISEFNATFASNPNLTAEQIASIRAGLDYYNDAGRIYLSNPKTIAFVQMYEALGLIGVGRAAEVLNG